MNVEVGFPFSNMTADASCDKDFVVLWDSPSKDEMWSSTVQGVDVADEEMGQWKWEEKDMRHQVYQEEKWK